VNRDALRPVALALLALLAVALVSATVTNVTEPTGGSGGGPEDGSPGGDGSGGLAPDESPEGQPVGASGGSPVGGQFCVPELGDPWVRLGLTAALALLFAAVWYRTDVVASAVLVGAIVLPLSLLYLALTCSGPSEAPDQAAPGADAAGEAGGTGQGGGVPETVFNAPLWLVVLVGAVAVAITLITVSRAGGVRELVGGGRTEDDEAGGTTDVAAVGRVAGRAADRIETGTDADNEVFRAWRSMTEHLDVDRPESSTPREFADAAVAAGFARADVTELTDLFAAVRYGGEDATDDREQRAVAALRRIEAASEDVDDPGADADGGDDGTSAGPGAGDGDGESGEDDGGGDE